MSDRGVSADEARPGSAGAATGRGSGPQRSPWALFRRSCVLLLAASVVIVPVGTVVLAAVVEGVGGAFLILFLWLGPCIIAYGVTLTPEEHARKPKVGEDGFLGLWVAHHLPLRVARLAWVVIGALWSAVLVVSCATLVVSVISGPGDGPTGSPVAVAPYAGEFTGAAHTPYGGFEISFRVFRSGIRDEVSSWNADCQTGKTWGDHSLSAYVPLSGWSGASDYVTQNSNGITEHVHIIKDTGHFTSATRASGVFELLVGLYQSGRRIDTCKTGIVRWTSHRRPEA